MKKITVAFWLLAVFVGLQFLLWTFRGVPYIRDYTGVLRWMWITKIGTYIGIMVSGYLLYRIMQTLKRHGYFDQTSTVQVRRFAYASLITAVLNAGANTCLATWKLHQKDVRFGQAREDFIRYFLEEIFDQSLILFLFVLFIFLFYAFIQRAIAVKNENESFI